MIQSLLKSLVCLLLFAANNQAHSAKMRSLLGEGGAFQVFVRMMDGSTTALEMPANAKVSEVFAACGLDPISSSLSFQESPLDNDAFLADTGICAEALLVATTQIFKANDEFLIEGNSATLRPFDQSNFLITEICLSKKITVGEETHIKLTFSIPTDVTVISKRIHPEPCARLFSHDLHCGVSVMNINFNAQNQSIVMNYQSSGNGSSRGKESAKHASNDDVYEICIRLEKGGRGMTEYPSVQVEYFETAQFNVIEW